MSFGDRHLDNALDRWLTTDPFDRDEDGDYGDYCGCPETGCSFEGSTADMDAHVAKGEHNRDYQITEEDS